MGYYFTTLIVRYMNKMNSVCIARQKTHESIHRYEHPNMTERRLERGISDDTCTRIKQTNIRQYKYQYDGKKCLIGRQVGKQTFV